MELMAYLVVVSLIFVSWSYGLVGPTASETPKGHAVPEQPFDRLRTALQRDQPPVPEWWTWDVWAEWLCPPRRKPRRWRRLILSLYELRRWYRQRVQRWRLLRREWRESTESTSRAEPLPKDARSSTPLQEANPTATPQPASSKETPSATAAQGAAEEPIRPSHRGPGRPRTIPTDHLCCPNEKCSSYGIPGPDPVHDIVGHGTYTTAHGEKRQMFECKVCGKTFSETAGTPFFGLETPMHTVCTTLEELSEGLGVRAVARTHEVKPDTVLEWIRKAGRHCEQVSEYTMQELELAQVQMDEMWTFVHEKQRRLSEDEKTNSEWGDTWIWIAFDPLHELVVAMSVGDRTEEEAMGLLSRLRARLAERPLPLFTSDSLAHYAKAILHTFGVWVRPRRNGDRGRFPKPRPVPPEELDYATVHEERKKGRVVSVTTQVVYGRTKDVAARLKPLGQKINTSYVERVNLTLRHLVSRLHRKTLCFSKKREYLEYHLHLSIAYYHFVLHHSSLRVRLPEPLPTRGNGSPKIWAKRTPAMAAGLTDHKWSTKELLMFHVPGAGC